MTPEPTKFVRKKATSNLAKMLIALRYGRGLVRILAGTASLFVAGGVIWGMCVSIFHLPQGLSVATFALGLGGILTVVTTTLQRVEDQNRFRFRVEAAEKKIQANPNQPQLAWELARVKLESYLSRNLAQVKSIFVLTVVVMLVGFALIAIGSYWAFRDQVHFKAAVLSSVSGVIVSFIGGTFLVLYKATMAQAKDYVTILERINAVGMSVQILESLSEDPVLKRESMAEIAKQLLHMYSTSIPGAGRSKKRASEKVQ